VAVGTGVFIGLTPFYGLHTILAIAAGWALRLNITAVILATQIANPFSAPILIVASAWLGSWMVVPATNAAWYDPTHSLFYLAWLQGGLVLGLVLGTVCGAMTFLVASRLNRGHSG
ncbi:MAG: DUF2062 domain-containing protein, partial [Acidobacteriota bacterium]